MLELDHVGFSYGKRLILDNASALFEEGSTTAIMGPSGSGKTTLLRLMDGSLQPDTGSVTIDGANVNSIEGGECRLHAMEFNAPKKSSRIFMHAHISGLQAHSIS